MAAVLPAALSLLIGAGQAKAEPWQALAIGQPGQGAESSFADAFHAAETLRRIGIGPVGMLRDADPAALSTTLGTLTPGSPLLIYYSGRAEGGNLSFNGGTVALESLLADLAAQGHSRIALLLENCASAAGATQPLTPPAPPEGIALFTAASAGPDQTCTTGARLTDLLRSASQAGAGETLQELLSPLWTQSTLNEPLTIAAPRPAAAAAPPAAPVISIISNDVVALSPVVATVKPVTALAPVKAALSQPRGQADPASGGNRDQVVFFAPPAQSQLAALPQADGLPEPSIIVGLIDGANNASFDTVTPPGELTSTEITYDNLEARVALRDQDPELFAQLVASGAFDPPPPLLPRAIQTELSRMGCYTARIDGVWGGGSRASVERYFDELDGVTAASLEPQAELFRQIIGRKDVTCPAPQTATRAPAPTTRATTTRNTTRSTGTTARAAPAPKPRAAPAPAAKPTRKIQSGTTLGVFR